MEPVAIWSPLVVAASALAATIMIHALALNATVLFVRHEVRLGRAGAGLWIDAAIVAVAVLRARGSPDWDRPVGALVHGLRRISRVCHGVLPLGRQLHDPGLRGRRHDGSWKFLAPLEAANGMLMFGVSTAVIFAVIQRLAQARFADLRA